MKKKTIAFIVGILLVCVGLGFGIAKIVNANRFKERNEQLSVAFYDLPETVTSALEKAVSDNCEKPVKFDYIQASAFDAKKIASKYDLFFSWNGKAVSDLEQFAEKIPNKCYANQPSSYNVPENKRLNVIVDHYEIAYNIEKVQQLHLDFPATFDELETFLTEMTGLVFCPFICEGSDDETLLALLGCFIEGKAGSKAYKDFLEQAAKKSDFESVINLPIKGADGTTFTLASILDELKTWPEKGFTHPNWCLIKDFDIETFMDSDQVAVVFSSLTKHRQMTYKNVRKYEACRFPVKNENAAHGVIAPSVSAVKLRNAGYINDVLIKLVTSEVQEGLSSETKLALASSKGQSYDRQADDVRFWTAACNDGPLPDLYNAVYQLNADKGKNFADQVRQYLKK